MTAALDSQPFCGFCAEQRKVRPRLRLGADGRWHCPVCRAVTYYPGEGEGGKLEVRIVEGASITRERAEQLQREWESKPHIFQSGSIERKGDRKSGRSRKSKTVKPIPWYRRYGTAF